MDAKLTLKLDKQVIERAKQYAASHKRSLSRLIEAYLKSLTIGEEPGEDDISPFVRSLSSGVKIPTDLDYKKVYAEHQANKHK